MTRPVQSSTQQSHRSPHTPAQNQQASQPQNGGAAQMGNSETPMLDKILTQEHKFVPLGEEDSISLSAWHVYTYLANPTRSGKMPTNQDCIKFTIMCRQRKLNPWAGDCYLLGYDTEDGPKFSIITAHQALLSRAEAHHKYEGMQSGVIVAWNEKDADGKPVTKFEEREGDLTYEGETLLGGWAKVYRADRKFPSYQRLKLSTYDKKNKQWRQDGAGMICKCAEAAALRQAFPSVIGGMYLRDEVDAFHTRSDAAGSGSTRTGSGGAFDLDQLTGRAPMPARGELPDGSGGPPEGQDDPFGGADGIDQPAADEGSQEAPGGPDGEAAGPQSQGGHGGPPGSVDLEAMLTGYQYEIDQARTSGALDKLADHAMQEFPPGHAKSRVMDLISAKRTELSGGRRNKSSGTQTPLPGTA